MQDKIRIQEPDTAPSTQPSTLITRDAVNDEYRMGILLTWAECFDAMEAWVHVSGAGEAETQATPSIQRPVTSRGDICNDGDQSSVQVFLFV